MKVGCHVDEGFGLNRGNSYVAQDAVVLLLLLLLLRAYPAPRAVHQPIFFARPLSCRSPTALVPRQNSLSFNPSKLLACNRMILRRNSTKGCTLSLWLRCWYLRRIDFTGHRPWLYRTNKCGGIKRSTSHSNHDGNSSSSSVNPHQTLHLHLPPLRQNRTRLHMPPPSHLGTAHAPPHPPPPPRAACTYRRER